MEISSDEIMIKDSKHFCPMYR